MSTARAQRLVAILLVVAAAVWLGRREHYYSRWMDDDAFISFRYARNSGAPAHLFLPGTTTEFRRCPCFPAG